MRLRTKALVGATAIAMAASLVVSEGSPAEASQPARTSTEMTAQPLAAKRYVIKGKMGTAYRKNGGARRFGKPVRNQRCGLPEGACTQRFQRGVIYLQKNGRAWATSSTGTRGEILMVARSQVGFKQKNHKVKTKYSRYTGEGSYRWCNDFHSWTAYASGNRNVIPKIPNYERMKKWMRSNWKKLRSPKRGAYVILNGSKYQSHMAVVYGVKSGNRITIVEGNWGYAVGMRTIKVQKSMEFRWPY